MKTHLCSSNDILHRPFIYNTKKNRPKEDSKGKRKAEEAVGAPEELLAALNFAGLEGSVPPWATGGKNWDPENGGLTERHIQVGWFVLRVEFRAVYMQMKRGVLCVCNAKRRFVC